MPLWFILALIVLHFGAMLSLLAQGNYRMALVMFGGFVINVGYGLILSTR